MKLNVNVFLCVVVVAVFTGCMTTTPFQSLEQDSQRALVYVYRPESLISRGTHFSLTVNGSEVTGPFVNNGYKTFYADPGSVEIVLFENTIPKGKLDSLTLPSVKGGEVYYIKAVPGLFGAYKLMPQERSTGVSEISGTLQYHDN